MRDRREIMISVKIRRVPVPFFPENVKNMYCLFLVTTTHYLFLLKWSRKPDLQGRFLLEQIYLFSHEMAKKSIRNGELL